MIKFVYQKLVRPLLFKFDAEAVHNLATLTGESLENLLPDWQLKNPKKVLGVTFPNPVGLAAGLDYDGHLAKVLPKVGFGFATIGTVTAKPYDGNTPPRLARLPLSGSILVNKGFKSEGAAVVADRLDQKGLTNQILGISVGSSNLPDVNTITKAIDDYLTTFAIFKDKPYVKYFELNISCPNTAITESFTEPKNFQELILAIAPLKIKPPIFVKMPNEITFQDSTNLIRISLKYNLRGFIFSNLVKDRRNPAFNRREIATVKNLKGNFSGRITAAKAKNLLLLTRKKFGREVALISVGGIFTPQDAQERFALGANLVQLITGMIYEGPQLPREIVRSLV